MESGNAKKCSKRRVKGRSKPQSDSALVTRIKEKQKLLRYLYNNYIPHLLPQLDFDDPKMRRISDNIVNYRPVGEEFQKRREKRKLTIKEVSNILKIPQYVLKDIEEGAIRNVSPEKIRKYAVYLGLEELLKFFGIS